MVGDEEKLEEVMKKLEILQASKFEANHKYWDVFHDFQKQIYQINLPDNIKKRAVTFFNAYYGHLGNELIGLDLYKENEVQREIEETESFREKLAGLVRYLSS